jgi:hypothetical protein
VQRKYRSRNLWANREIRDRLSNKLLFNRRVENDRLPQLGQRSVRKLADLNDAHGQFILIVAHEPAAPIAIVVVDCPVSPSRGLRRHPWSLFMQMETFGTFFKGTVCGGADSHTQDLAQESD